MANLREKVTIKTFTIDLQGELFVGADGLPEVLVELSQKHTTPGDWHEGIREWTYRPATLPAAWIVCPLHASGWGVLYDAWTDIEAVMQHIRDAQREAEAQNE